MRRFAVLKNNVIVETVLLEEDEVKVKSSSSEMLIDIEDMLPQPSIGWVLNGNKLEIPSGCSDRERFEIELASRKTDFGIKLSRTAVDRIGARNKILNKTGEQVATLLNSLISVKLLLETGALGTARAACVQLKLVYTEYADIFDFVVAEINVFESTFGL